MLQSYHRKHILDKVNIQEENIHSFPTTMAREDIFHLCRDYEQEIVDCGGLDLTICEVGRPDHRLQRTRIASFVKMPPCASQRRTRQTISTNFNTDTVPSTAITLGIGNILFFDQNHGNGLGRKPLIGCKRNNRGHNHVRCTRLIPANPQPCAYSS